MIAEAGYWYVLDDLGSGSARLSYLEILNECPDGFHVVELSGQSSTYVESWYRRSILEARIDSYGVHKEALP